MVYIQGWVGKKSYLLFLDVSNFVFKAYESIINVCLICLGRRGSRAEGRLQGAQRPLAFPMLTVVHLGLGWLHCPLFSLLWMAWRWLVTKRRWRELHHWNRWGWRREGGEKVRNKTKLRLQALNSLKSLDPRPSKFSSTEVRSKLNVVLNTVLSFHYLEGSSCQALAPLRRQKSTTWGMVPEIQFPT